MGKYLLMLENAMYFGVLARLLRVLSRLVRNGVVLGTTLMLDTGKV